MEVAATTARSTRANFTEKLIGDYDSFPDNEARKELNRAIVPLFADRILGPGDGLEKIESLRDSARGPPLRLWMRDPDVQAAVADIGLSGELSDTEHDYVAVFNQNTNVSKSDYWQSAPSPATSSCARTARPGSGMTISVHNDSPPYGATSSTATHRGGSVLHALERHDRGRLPARRRARSRSASAAGKALGTDTFDYYGRPYKLLRLILPPGETREGDPRVRRPCRRGRVATTAR